MSFTLHYAMIRAVSCTAAGAGASRLQTKLLRLGPVFNTSVRHTSLSAIHRGLRQSERAQYGEPRSDKDAVDQKLRQFRRDSLTSRAIEGAGSPRQRHKLQKKLGRQADDKNDDVLGRQTRRKRFLDPKSSFGKQSLVYQLKNGALRDDAAELNLQEPVRPRPRTHRFERRDTRRPTAGSRPSSYGGRGSLGIPADGRRQGRHAPPTSEKRAESTSMRNMSLDIEGDEMGDASTAARLRKKGMMPMTVKYTTAASQFLYGKSVVKAALEQARRKLYHLYIYGGENRKNSSDNATMTRLAVHRNVPVTVVPNGEQRLMDKMSMGRPHNGFVLESSPLPQIPVLSLGNLEESPSKLGFHVELDYQTKEEESINGQDTFITRSSDMTPKPFVLLLNEILDPGNLGGLLRTASYMGVDAVGITSRSSSALTPVVLKSAAGAVEEITIFTVASPVSFLEESKKAGWRTYAAVAPPERKLARKHGDKFVSTDVVEQDDPLQSDPCILVLGNEGHGLSKPIKMTADYEVSIPRFVQKSSVDSLNVSVAAGILCRSFVRRPAAIEETTPQPETETVVDDAVAVADERISTSTEKLF